MQNAARRHAARLILGGREATLIRLALASRFSAVFAKSREIVAHRAMLYQWLSQELIRGRSFDYLEFGVFRGESISQVAALNENPAVRLFGFDSFEGLPTDWNPENPKGTFNVNGQAPATSDRRIEFIKGWFDRTLPEFVARHRPQEQVWIHIDADLYSSAMLVLTLLNPCITTGTIVVFDEVEDLMNEFRALCDYQDMSGKVLELVASTPTCRQAAFVCR
jgi:hypothetical protein